MDKNIIIKDDNFRFNFRVAGIFINNNKILLQSTTSDTYLFLPGGRVQYNETTKDAIKREMAEEIGINIQDSELTLIHVVENFFKHNEKDYHEILFVYLINNKDINGKELIEVIDKDEAINKWYSIDELKYLDVRPKEIINNINTNQIIHDIILD